MRGWYIGVRQSSKLFQVGSSPTPRSTSPGMSMFIMVMLFAGQIAVFDNGTGHRYPFDSALACKQMAEMYVSQDSTGADYKLACLPADQFDDIMQEMRGGKPAPRKHDI